MCFPTEFMVQVRTTAPATPSSPKLCKNRHFRSTSKAAPVKKRSIIKNKKRSVRFQERATVVLRHASTAELQQAWNQPHDISNIKTGIRQSLLALQQVQGNLSELDDQTHCFRGLESGISAPIYKLRKMWVKTTTQNVLDEQRVQKSQGIVDMQRLGEVARASSAEAIRCATAMAALDAKQA